MSQEISLRALALLPQSSVEGIFSVLWIVPSGFFVYGGLDLGVAVGVARTFQAAGIFRSKCQSQTNSKERCADEHTYHSEKPQPELAHTAYETPSSLVATPSESQADRQLRAAKYVAGLTDENVLLRKELSKLRQEVVYLQRELAGSPTSVAKDARLEEMSAGIRKVEDLVTSLCDEKKLPAYRSSTSLTSNAVLPREKTEVGGNEKSRRGIRFGGLRIWIPSSS